MTKIFHIAKANILKHKGAALSLFAIIMIVSALTTIGLSALLEIEKDYDAGVERLHSLHSLVVMHRDKYEAGFEDIIKNDTRVAEYEITEVLSGAFKINYGGEIEWLVIIDNIDKPLRISSPNMKEIDISVPSQNAIYLPLTAKTVGYGIGDTFTIVYVNKRFDFIVAGFFETNELSITNSAALKFFVSKECYENLSRQLTQYVWVAVRHWNTNDSTGFIYDFLDKSGLDTGFMNEANFFKTFDVSKQSDLFPVITISVIILLFSAIIVIISLIVIRFRVTNSIDDTMREIGVLKAAGYTSRQITSCYLAEYGLIALPSSILGIFIPIPVFGLFRNVFSSVTSLIWTFGVNITAAFAAALVLLMIVLFMVRLSSRKIKKLPPVDALRGGIATNNFRRNYFPLDRGIGNVHLRLGIKNMFAHFKLYAMIGIVIAGICVTVTIIYVMYHNFALDPKQLIRMSGYEQSDISLTVTKHTDANAFATELEKMSEVRKTSMLEVPTLRVDGYSVMGYMSNDFGKMEILATSDGRLPKYDNEAAIPKLFADTLGKKIGDSVLIKANGVTQDFIITGFFSTFSNYGQVTSITLDGFKRLDPNARRSNIKIYLDNDVDYNAFLEKLKSTYGVLNVFRQKESDEFTMAKARAEEKISTYLERYAVDSVEYAVLYNGEIILRGSSSEYQIKTITNDRELLSAQIGNYAAIISSITRLISLVSLVILSLILYMTVRSIVAKRRRELGILKSNGFTTKQLARQLAISFMPLTGAGVITGCVIGAVSANPLLGQMFAYTGIYNSSFTVSPIAVTIIGTLALLVTFTVANISAMRIKRISVYELISE